ncbi:unnamed protein product [Rhizoctonia solani]|uniref:Uncharacterized protein n=1 Tax=Rhizoctonia solani TaxID=456999 RepID=A0A8H3BRY5_9AGAM|nr:unnamed protein product [Rhizoctonia solani]
MHTSYIRTIAFIMGLDIHTPSSGYLICVHVDRQLIMNENTAAVIPRRLVVIFYNPDWVLAYTMIEDDKGDRQQLVYEQRILCPPPPPRPSRLERLLMRLGRKPPPSKASENVKQSNAQAIADAHGFVSRNYRSGDQVILRTDRNIKEECVIEAMEILARHLHNGTTPGQPSEAQPGRDENAPGRLIPIYAVAALWWNGPTESVSVTNDGLKSRFPPGIQHIICYQRSYPEARSCSTEFDLDGGVISREISMYDTAGLTYDTQNWHTTKHIIYHIPDRIPDWHTQKPVWTKELDSSPSGIPGNSPSSTLPAGMYRHELRRYQGGPEGSDRLVWKSFRH